VRTYRHGRVDVADEPTPVCMVPQDISQVLVRNTGSVTVYVGGEDVCVDDGFPLKTDDRPLSVPCFDFDCAQLWAVSAKGKSGVVAFLVLS
jgi:hypothetical protein